MTRRAYSRLSQDRRRTDLLEATLSCVADLGLDRAFWKVAMRPGKPLMAGKLGGVPMIGLPGNPVSALVCAELFLSAALMRLQGRQAAHPRLLPARLAVPLKANDTRQDYIRAALEEEEDGEWRAEPLSVQDSSMLSGLARAGCLIVRPPHAAAAEAGALVNVLPLEG